MGAGQAVAIWFIASGIACIALLAWTFIVGLGAGRHRALALILLALTATLALMPSSLGRLRIAYDFSFSPALFIGASLCLSAAISVLWKMRRTPDVRHSADLAIAACLNLWLALAASLSPLSHL